MFSDIDIFEILVKYGCLLFSLCVHEAAHAKTAELCGDNTARFMGRVSLNPLVHIDPIGTVIMPLLMFTTNIPFLIGWAKPVPVNPRNFFNRSRGNILVSLAGPASNLLLVVVFAIILRLMVVFTDTVSGDQALAILKPLFSIAYMMVILNLVLMMFNLLPIPPLDGSHLLYEIVGERGQRVMDQIGPFGIIFVVLIGGRLIGGPLEALLDIIMRFVLGS